MIRYPEIDNVAIALGPLKIHWYGVMYVLGFVAAYFLLRYRARKGYMGFRPEEPEDILFYGMVGLILGGRLFYMLVYGFDQIADNPLALFKIWEGGMSFHGGLLGVIVAMWVYARKSGHGFFNVTDFLAPTIPPGLFFGRLGNFINGELWGKPTEVPWAFYYEGTARPEVAAVFADGEARHPSQLYEAGLEGLAMFVILWAYSIRPRPTMAVSGLFLVLYGVFRFAVEFVRVPDSHMGDDGYLAFGWLTTGQALSAPMIVAGVVLIAVAYLRTAPRAAAKSEAS